MPNPPMLTLKRDHWLVSLFVFLGLLDLWLRFSFLDREVWVCNEGIAWGIRIPTEVLGVLILLFLGYVALLWVKSEEAYERLGFAGVFLGGSMNALDRLFHGCVLDYFTLPGVWFSFLPSFNLADMMLILSLVWLGWTRIYRKSDSR